jgi:hypothetical protein
MVEQLASFAENATEGFGHGEDELPVRHVEAKNPGNPITGRADFALMAARAEVARLAGEGEEALVPAIGAAVRHSRNGNTKGKIRVFGDSLASLVREGKRGPLIQSLRCSVSH